MKRVAVTFNADQYEEIRRVALERRTSVAKLLRELALEILDDEEDIREGLKALADDGDTITLEEYQRLRQERESRGGQV